MYAYLHVMYYLIHSMYMYCTIARAALVQYGLEAHDVAPARGDALARDAASSHGTPPARIAAPVTGVPV